MSNDSQSSYYSSMEESDLVAYESDSSQPIEVPSVDLGSSSDSEHSQDVQFERLYIREDDPSPFLLPDQLGLEFRNNNGRFTLINIVQFRNPNTDFVKIATGNTFVANYFPVTGPLRPAALNVQQIFGSQHAARTYFEKCLGAYMKDGEPLPTLEDFKRGDCFLWPGTDVDSGYISIRGPNGERVSLHHLVVYAYLGHWLYERDDDGELLIGDLSPIAVDLSHRCHHRSCFNPFHFFFELGLINRLRRRKHYQKCICGQDPTCLLGQQVVSYARVKRAVLDGTGRAWMRKDSHVGH